MSKLISGIKELYVSYSQKQEWQGQQGQEQEQGIAPKAPIEHFRSHRYHDTNIIGLLLAIVLVILLQVIIGKYIWNCYITRIIPAFKPVKSYVDILALFIMAALLF
jgi:hypothetical protein